MRPCGVTGEKPIEEYPGVLDSRYMEFAARLRVARQTQGITQAELGRRLGKPQSFVSKLETCEHRPDLIEALLICKALRVSLAAIVPAEFISLLVVDQGPGKRRKSPARKVGR